MQEMEPGNKEGEHELLHSASQCTATKKEAECQPQFMLEWKKGADMPIQSSMIRMQAVTVSGEAYVGSGITGDGNVVLKYDSAKDEWVRLTDHTVYDFGLCQFREDLYSIGGSDLKKGIINLVYRYRKTDNTWVEALKPMPTARFNTSVLSTDTAIIVCGGDNGYGVVPIVEVYSISTIQWHTAEPLPQPGLLMSTVTIGEYGYLLGGQDDNEQGIRAPFQADLPKLVERAVSLTKPANAASIWKTLQFTPLLYSAAATVSGKLLAIGGMDSAETAQPKVYMLSASETWEALPNSLPAERYLCTAAQLPGNQVLVTGGRDKAQQYTNTSFVGSLVA